MVPPLIDVAPSGTGARGLMPSHARSVDWTNPLTRGLVDLWPGVQLASVVRKWTGLANSGGAVVSDVGGPIWRQAIAQLANYGDSSPENFDRLDAFTITFQVGWSALGANDAILNRCMADATRRGWCVYKDAADCLRFVLASNMSAANHLDVRFAFTPAPSVLYRVVLTCAGTADAAGVSCYVDGAVLPRSTVQDSLAAATTASTYLRIGYRDVDGWGHNGWLRDIAIWGRALRGDEACRYFADPGQLLLREPGPVWLMPPPAAVATSPLAPLRTFVAGDALQLSAGLG